ncbi:hypothetical protein M441DRAFT_47557 [Trichoderma asperellum CBS 433.97]|uniref:Single-strand DNA deaminase toxin A-like C-terminal domain-containing protein n=1 Tax=Trichoderma asperellum (strain ATCC 204424 / CBS 433.97 / NBRC 101777) TaxID=1042311 RepID=A0A2T3Z8E3_TRIA4|nr:hypothetical protein M441DRAFT_47557 [Trichoderma asperellum CBS 433.97]PTB41081.1 hypothetical protein M441DRAFT_47557 [Trichoderma asperellum CBS 433.97]
MWDFSTLRFVSRFCIRRASTNKSDSQEETARKRNLPPPAAIVLCWDARDATVLCPFCDKTHKHAFTHFKKDNRGRIIQDDCGRYVYDGPSATQRDYRRPLCDQMHAGLNLQYVILFPFEYDRVKGLSYEIEQRLDADGRVQVERFRTVSMRRTISNALEAFESCSLDEAPEEREIINLQSLSLDTGDYEVTTRLNRNGEDIADTQRASELVTAAACSGDLDGLKRVLDNSPDRNGLLQLKDQDGRSLLSLAASNGHHEVAEYLLEAGSDINVMDDKGRTPLMEAALWGYPRIVGMLLQAGSDKRLTDQRGMMAINLAEESERNDFERHKRSANYSENPFLKKKDRTLIRGLLKTQPPRRISAPLRPCTLQHAYFYRSYEAGTISLVTPLRGMHISAPWKTAAILFRGDAFPPIAALSGHTDLLGTEFSSPEDGFKMLNQGHWAYESLRMAAEDIDVPFEPHANDGKDGPMGIYNACHAEAQLMCFFVKKNYLFRDYAKGEINVVDDFLQLFMLQQQQKKLRAEIFVSNAPCRSCINLKNRIFERLKIEFIFKTLPVRQSDS